MARTTVDELRSIADEMFEAWVDFKADSDRRYRSLRAELFAKLDGGDIARQKAGLDSRPKPSAPAGPFLSLDQSIASHFPEEDTNPKLGLSTGDLREVRVGALLAAIAGGQPVMRQLRDVELQALGTITGPGGGYTVPEVIAGQFLDAVRPRARVQEAGALSYPMSAPTVHLPGWEEPIKALWKAELEQREETTAPFRRITLEAKTCTTFVELSRELLEDAADNLGGIISIVEAETAKALASAVDLAALFGLGQAAEPLGLYFTEGVNELELGSGDGATPTDYDFLLDAMFELEDANFDPSAVIWSPRTANTLRKLVTGISGDKTKLSMPDEVRALSRLATNQVPNTLTVGSSNDCSAAFVGDWSQLVIGYRPDIGIRALQDPYSGADRGAIRLHMWLRADVAALNRTAFTVVRGIRD